MTKILSNFSILRPILIILIIFIPLYPKFPLFNVNHTYVAIRLDDIVIAVSLFFWLLYQIKHRFPILKEKVLLVFMAYFVAIILSFIHALLIYQTEPANILVLHLFRRFEYMSLFFLAVSAIKSLNDLKVTFWASIVAAIGVSLYGYGQKYFQLPVVSTMNSEFSKGQLLQMDIWTRISSTFAGHYDLAAYLSVVLIIVAAISVIQKNIFLKFIGLLFWLNLFNLLNLTASRVSNFAMIGGLIVTLILIRKFLWIIPFSLIFVFSLFNSKDLNQRLLATIPSLRNQFFPSAQTTPKPTLVPTPTIILPTPTPGAIANITPVPTVFRHGPIDDFIPIDADVGVARSGEIRFNVEWPRAINSFKKNYLLGTGLGSITLATDNDYLRLLGESGALGFITFAIIFIYFSYMTLKSVFVKKLSSTNYLVLIMFGCMVTFLANATLIDVFEASKTAYLFWILMGAYHQALKLVSKNDAKT